MVRSKRAPALLPALVLLVAAAPGRAGPSDPDSIPVYQVKGRQVITTTIDTTAFAADTTATDTAFVRPPKTFRHAVLVTGTLDDEEDFFLGLDYRFIVFPDLDIGLLAAGAVRFENKYVLEEIRSHFYLQLEEYYRVLLSLSVDKVQRITGPLGIYGGIGAAYCFGDYSGTNRKAVTAWSPIVDVGLNVRSNGNPARFVLRAGYQYADRVTSGDNAFYLALGVGL